MNSHAVFSETQNIFSSFSPFLKSTWTFEPFEQRSGPHSRFKSETIDCKKCGYLNA